MFMTSRNTRSNTSGTLVTLSNQKLAKLERTNQQTQRPNNIIIDELAAELQRKQQQMLQMQQTIQQQQTLHQAEQQQAAPIGQRNLAPNFPITLSATAPPACARQDYEIKPAMSTLV